MFFLGRIPRVARFLSQLNVVNFSHNQFEGLQCQLLTAFSSIKYNFFFFTFSSDEISPTTVTEFLALT